MAKVAFKDSSARLTVYEPESPGDPGEDGAWRVAYYTPSGIRRFRRWRGTRDEVRRQAKRMAKELNAGREGDWRDRTFREMAEAYLDCPDHAWPDTTRRNQKRGVRILCDDAGLGGEKLGGLAYSPKRSRQALRRLAQQVRPRTGRPYAQSSLKLYRDLLGTLWSWGQQEEWLPAELSPMRRVGTPRAAEGAKVSAKQRARSVADDGDEVGGLVVASEMPTLEQAEALGVQWMERSPGRPEERLLAVRFAATSGPRWGEQHALRPRDFRWAGEVPRVRIARKLTIDTSGSVSGFSAPKNGSARWSYVAPHLAEELRALCDRVTSEFGPDGLLWPSPRDPGSPYEPDSFGTTVRNYAPDAGWPVDEHGQLVWTWHSLRHTAAVWALRDVGIYPSLVSKSLGHASVSFTMDRYVGTDDSSWDRAANLMNDWARGGGQGLACP